MEGSGYLVAAYIVVWVGLLLYLGIVALRMRGVRTELAAMEELLSERQDESERA